MGKRTTLSAFGKRKREGEKIVMITAYDAPSAAAAADSGIDIILVGDSLGPTVLGYRNTVPVTMEDMLHHAAAVRRGAPDAFVIFDMPFMSYQENREKALHNAARAIKEIDCDAVKLEGGAEYAPLIADLVAVGIPVVAHIGLLPQRVQVAGYRVQGRTEDAAARLIEDAKKVESAGACAVVLECMPAELSTKISQTLTIPTIGIGSGVGCDGQVQVMNDLIGLFDEYVPHHAKRYAEVGKIVREALKQYAAEVRSGSFPDEEHSFH